MNIELTQQEASAALELIRRGTIEAGTYEAFRAATVLHDKVNVAAKEEAENKSLPDPEA